MHRKSAAIVILALAVAAGAAGATISARTGPTGSAQSRQARPSALRIVSLLPSVTETLFALDAGAEVVGVSQYCDYPKAALALPKVGSFLQPNLEAVVALRPTLIIGEETASNQPVIQALAKMGYAQLMVSDDSVEAIERSIAVIGARIGRRPQASRLVNLIRDRISTVRKRLAGVRPIPVLMLVGHQPMVAVGRGTYLDELLRMAGGRNVADISSQSWPQLNIEYVIASRPQVIIDGQMGNDPSAGNGFWARYPGIPAVRDHHVFGYAADPMLHPGPRVWQSLDILASLIHPKAMANAPAAHRIGPLRRAGGV